MPVGFAYVFSLILLTTVVCVVYSTAQDAFAPIKTIAHNALRRAGKLVGVLGILAVAVYILSKI